MNTHIDLLVEDSNGKQIFKDCLPVSEAVEKLKPFFETTDVEFSIYATPIRKWRCKAGDRVLLREGATLGGSALSLSSNGSWHLTDIVVDEIPSYAKLEVIEVRGGGPDPLGLTGNEMLVQATWLVGDTYLRTVAYCADDDYFVPIPTFER